ncbi:phage tail tube protein [Fusobacterium necrophorum]|uniref:phage tail tube protein n=1 Tax=Fusobacterium necrophorum TaxID=859 RepID=UPI00370E1959
MNLKIGVGVQENSDKKATKITQLRVTESDLKPLRNIVDSDEFNGSPWKGDSFLASESASGSITCHLTVETLKLLLPGFGFDVTEVSLPDTTGISEPKVTLTNLGKYTASGKIEKFFTIVEQNLEDQEERALIGCQFGNVTIEASQGAYVTMTLEVIGFSYGYKQDSLSEVELLEDYSNRLTCVDATFHMSKDLSANTQSINVSINQNLEAKFGLGSTKATRITRNGKIEAKCSLTFNAYDKALYKKAYDNLLSGETAEAVIKMKTKDKKYIGIYLHKLGTTNVEMTDKKGGGGLSQELDIQYDQSKKTPITFAIGTVQ